MKVFWYRMALMWSASVLFVLGEHTANWNGWLSFAHIAFILGGAECYYRWRISARLLFRHSEPQG